MSGKIVEGAQFHEDLASSWSSGYQSGGFQKRLVILRALLGAMVVKDSNWLDAGCGTGLLTRELNEMGAIAIGIDASPEMIGKAESESVEAHQSIIFREVASVESIDMPSDEFDGILCSSVIEYVDCPSAVFSEFSRILKPGGKLLISVPNKRSLIRNLQKSCKLIVSWLGGNIFSYLDYSKHEFTLSKIKRSLSKAGFTTETVEAFDPLLPQLISNLGMGSLLVVSAQLKEAPQFDTPPSNA